MKQAKGRRVAALAISVVAVAGALAAACNRQAVLGLPDSYLVFAPAFDKEGTAQKSPAGLPILEQLALDDQRAMPLHQQIGVGIVGEMIRTDYLAKQLVRDLALGGETYPAAARAAASQPTVLVVGRGLPPLAKGFATKG